MNPLLLRLLGSLEAALSSPSVLGAADRVKGVVELAAPLVGSINVAATPSYLYGAPSEPGLYPIFSCCWLCMAILLWLACFVIAAEELDCLPPVRLNPVPQVRQCFVPHFSHVPVEEWDQLT